MPHSQPLQIHKTGPATTHAQANALTIGINIAYIAQGHVLILPNGSAKDNCVLLTALKTFFIDGQHLMKEEEK